MVCQNPVQTLAGPWLLFTVYFCYEFVFDKETKSVMWRCNPSWVSPISTCGCHRTCNIKLPRATNASRFSPPLLLRHQDYFILFIDVHLRLRATNLRKRRTQCSCTRRGRIRLLGSVLRDCSIASPSSSSRFIYHFAGRAPTVIVYIASSSKLSGVFATPPSSKKRKHRTFSSI
jgi:hypothetical protein